MILYLDKFPVFTGIFEFDLTFKLLGKRVTRPTRVEFTFTPELEFFRPARESPFRGWGGSSMGLLVLSAPDPDVEEGEPTWEQVDLFDVLPTESIQRDAVRVSYCRRTRRSRFGAALPRSQSRMRSRRAGRSRHRRERPQRPSVSA